MVCDSLSMEPSNLPKVPSRSSSLVSRLAPDLVSSSSFERASAERIPISCSRPAASPIGPPALRLAYSSAVASETRPMGWLTAAAASPILRSVSAPRAASAPNTISDRDACAISGIWNGVRAANSVRSAICCLADSADPVKAMNEVSRVSICLLKLTPAEPTASMAPTRPAAPAAPMARAALPATPAIDLSLLLNPPRRPSAFCS